MIKTRQVQLHHNYRCLCYRVIVRVEERVQSQKSRAKRIRWGKERERSSALKAARIATTKTSAAIVIECLAQQHPTGQATD